MYIRFGADIGTLNVILQTSVSNLTVFTQHGPQGSMWKKGELDVQSTLSYKVIFEGIGKCIKLLIKLEQIYKLFELFSWKQF